MKVFIGIDNGVSGSIGMIAENDLYSLEHTPIKRCLNYTKKRAFLNRIDADKLLHILAGCDNPFCYIERPMVMPARWLATVSALRADEATRIVLEKLEIPFQYIDSKEWQKALLPSGLKKEELKFASLDVGKRLFPKMDWTKFKDADGLLIASYCERVRR